MRVITLSIVAAKSGVLSLSLDGEGGIAPVNVEGSPPEIVESLRADPSRLEVFLTPTLVRALRQWVMNEPGTSVLAVVCEVAQLDGIPWEHLPHVLEIRSVSVVRQVRQKHPIPDSRAKDAQVLLAAGWSGKPKFRLPGIMEELSALGNLCAAAGRSAQVLFDPTLEELTSACASSKPYVLHVVPPAIDTNSGAPRVVLSGVDDIQFVDVDPFLSILPKDHHPHLVVVNSCSSGAGKQGPSLTRMIVERWSTIAIGWLGIVEDLAAADFTRFLYSRLLEGHLLSEVMRAYESLQSAMRNAEQPARDFPSLSETMANYRPVPVIWTQDLAAVAEPVFPLRTTSTDVSETGEGLARATGGHVPRGSRAAKPKSVTPPDRKQPVAEPAEVASPRLELLFEPQPWLNPALLKNGRPAITRLVLNPDQSLRNVELAVTCDTGNGVSAVRQTIDLGRGPQPVSTEDRQFPALYELIEAGVPRRQINFTVTCKWEGRLLAERTIPVLWMGRAEWLDQRETWHFVPAFVNPYDDGVLDVLDKADGILKTIAGPTSSFSGYQMGDGDHVMKQVEALFICLREIKLSYIAPPPVSVFLPGTFQSSGQRVRRPEEVTTRHRGTCHDLAVLLASCLEHVGINPLVFLIHGHTFVGFWKSDETHTRFWEDARNQKLRLPQVPGREWIMTELKEIQELVEQKSIMSVEATKVTIPTATFAEALKEGSKHWQEKQLEWQPFDVAIDVRASRQGVQPL